MGGSGSGSRAANSRSGAGGAGQQAPASAGSPLATGATEAERFVAARLRQMARDPRFAQTRLREIEQKISQKAQRLEVEKRTIIHDQNGRMRTLNRDEKLRLARINRSLERLDTIDRKARVAAGRIERRRG